ncbi:hypothetical protein AWRI1631_121540 [Saccharomyces cerevisiae AWRI1631]|uniref:Uncharacterized protein n=1 Tax=Saccharomyces cerevisiae (strain AWRI1631) TaxID=545124 RepID=B5VN41_YEAS6|nr:hypothetical protein AWRI1631_121540 [Saccharomyces cerevisiae AWRI1631]
MRKLKTMKMQKRKTTLVNRRTKLKMKKARIWRLMFLKSKP